MRRQKCSKCGTMLDITKLEKGSKFACASCGAILVVGEAAVVKRSLKESGPAFTPKGKSEAGAPAPTRARQRAEEGAERASRRGAAPVGKSKLPLFLGGGAVLIIAIVVIIVLSGGEGGPGGAKGPTAAEWWAAKSVVLDTASADALRQWMDEARQRGYVADRAFWAPKEELIYKEILKREPADKGANVRAGNKSLEDYPGFAEIWEQMDDSFSMLPQDLKDFVDTFQPKTKEGEYVWLTPARYAEVAAKLDEFKEWRSKLEENPAAEAIDRGAAQARAIVSSSERRLEFGSVVEGPFILLLAYEAPQGTEPAPGDLLAEGKKWAGALKLVQAEFDQRIREPLGLPPIEGGKYYYDVVVPKGEDLAKFVRGEGFDATGDIPGFFSMRTRFAHVRAPVEARDKSLFGGDLAHEAVHQLQWHYSADPKVKLLNHMEEWTGIWLTEGLAEYVGGGIDLDPSTGRASFSGRPPRRVEFLQALRDNGISPIPIRDLIQLSSQEAFERYIASWRNSIVANEEMPEAAGQWLHSQPGLLASVLYSHSWLIVHFLYEVDDGKYRVKFLDLVLTALRGKEKPAKYRKDPSVAERFGSADDAFVEIFGMKDSAAWSELQREYERHFKRLLRGD